MDSTLALIHAISILEHWMSELTPFSKKTFPDIIWPAKSDQQESKFGRQLRCYASLPWYRFIVITYHFIDRLALSFVSQISVKYEEIRLPILTYIFHSSTDIHLANLLYMAQRWFTLGISVGPNFCCSL